MPKWTKWTLVAFGLSVVLSITTRGSSKNTRDIAATATDYASCHTLDGEALFRNADHDVDRRS